MNKKTVLFVLLVLVPVTCISALAFPEPTLTRTYLMKEIEPRTTTVAVGVELILPSFHWFGEAYLGDLFFGYVGYAPNGWLEAGLALHACLVPYPSLEAKLDLIGMFTDSSRLSCLLMGGVSAVAHDGMFDWVYHGGAALSYRVDDLTELYLGAGSDSISEALNLQAGAWFRRAWLGSSTNLKLVIGREAIEPMISNAAMLLLTPRARNRD